MRGLRLKTSHGGILDNLEEREAPVRKMMSEAWFGAGPPLDVPRLTDFLVIQEVYSLLGSDLVPPLAQYDEKFGLLLAPTQFLPRLAIARREAWLRGTTTGVAFLDIDDFKMVNSRHGEFLVDRSVLPIFMRALEAHVHSHGFAFRFGGDEYVLLLPNTLRESATTFLRGFQQKLTSLSFPSVADVITLSVGLTTASPESVLTDRELQERATAAKQVAKGNGKNCIAWMDGDA